MEKKASTFDNQILNISSQADKLSKEILDFQAKNVSEAFCAQIDDNFKDRYLNMDRIFSSFTKVINASNSSPNYSPHTGVYTVPCDGLYLVGLMVESINHVKVNLNVYRKDKSGKEWLTLFSHSHAANTIGSVVVPVTMHKTTNCMLNPAVNL
ncbi:hypothetical protein Btru_008838 [Bulinus truncatus]|nr:hypothetical protein Btru_008838 [Bulinus truncatus]